MTDAPTTANPNSAGTRFPFVSLEKAIGRAKELFDADQKGREMALSGAFNVWNYSEKSSGGFQTVAALKMYGLLKESSGGDSRKIALSDLALRYFRDEREDEKLKIAREFALKPKLVAALWQEWGASPPADAIARSHLKAERGLTDQGARSLLSIYKENLAFTSIKSGHKIDALTEEIQSEREGSSDFLVSTARDFLGVPGQRDKPMQQTVQLPSSQLAPVGMLPAGMRREVITLDEGDVVITFPDGLTEESFGDLKDHLDLFVKKMQRRSQSKGESSG